MPLPSASKLELAMKCAASAVLPRVEHVVEAAETGNDIHDFMRHLASMSPDEALERVPERSRARCEDIDLSGLPVGAQWSAEVALAYDVETETTRLIGYDVGRNYGPRQSPSEMFLSVDTQAVVDGVALVGDWKSGNGWVARPEDNWQLRVAALAVARWTGVESARGGLIRLPAGERPSLLWADFDAFELSLVASELRELYRRIERPDTVVPVMGEHCRFCPAYEACPATGRAIARWTRTPQQIEKDVADRLTPERAAQGVQLLRAVDDFRKKGWAILMQYAREHPFPLEDGTVFGEVEVEREALNADVVRRVLTEMHGGAVADVACDFETSKAAVERALRPVYESRKKLEKGVTLKALKDSVYARVRAEGGFTMVRRTEVKAHKPGAPRLPEGEE